MLLYPRNLNTLTDLLEILHHVDLLDDEFTASVMQDNFVYTFMAEKYPKLGMIVRWTREFYK